MEEKLGAYMKWEKRSTKKSWSSERGRIKKKNRLEFELVASQEKGTYQWLMND